jgi:hypothetical protein
VASVGDVLWVAIVGAEGDPAGPYSCTSGSSARGSAPSKPTDQQPHPSAQPLATFLDGQRLVIGRDPRRRVRLQLLPEQPGRMAVDVPGTVQCKLRAARQPADTPGKFIISASLSTRRRRISASRSPVVSARRGDSNGEAGTHDGAIKNTSSCIPRPTRRAASGRHRRRARSRSVRIGDDSGRPERQHEARELVDEELHRLEMHVRT